MVERRALTKDELNKLARDQDFMKWVKNLTQRCDNFVAVEKLRKNQRFLPSPK